MLLIHYYVPYAVSVSGHTEVGKTQNFWLHTLQNLVVETEKSVAISYRMINTTGAGEGDVLGFMPADSSFLF